MQRTTVEIRIKDDCVCPYSATHSLTPTLPYRVFYKERLIVSSSEKYAFGQCSGYFLCVYFTKQVNSVYSNLFPSLTRPLSCFSLWAYFRGWIGCEGVGQQAGDHLQSTQIGSHSTSNTGLQLQHAVRSEAQRFVSHQLLLVSLLKSIFSLTSIVPAWPLPLLCLLLTWIHLWIKDSEDSALPGSLLSEP